MRVSAQRCEGPPAIRALIGTMLFAMIDVLGRLSSRSWMARLGSRRPFAAFRRRLLVGWFHARRRGRRFVGLAAAAVRCSASRFVEFQEGENRGLYARSKIIRPCSSLTYPRKEHAGRLPGKAEASVRMPNTHNTQPRNYPNTNFRRLKCYKEVNRVSIIFLSYIFLSFYLSLCS